ncbi:DMT family transporter [Pectinatus sottacetonis]|uniref:DMT family transporter n=1 Tax=Pectinatus sottacetonis TaxID=1002795 RepID=UPI0018C65CF8|nr:multidrug efflux SMR transporter [Pectinatus sottacetonis]
MKGYVLLCIAIVCEVFSTSMLKSSVGFSRLFPSIIFIMGMGTSFYMFSQSLIYIPLNIAYAIWSGLGTVFTLLIAIIFWKENFNIYTFIGISLIIIGVLILNLKNPAH